MNKYGEKLKTYVLPCWCAFLQYLSLHYIFLKEIINILWTDFFPNMTKTLALHYLKIIRDLSCLFTDEISCRGDGDAEPAVEVSVLLMQSWLSALRGIFRGTQMTYRCDSSLCDYDMFFRDFGVVLCSLISLLFASLGHVCVIGCGIEHTTQTA